MYNNYYHVIKKSIFFLYCTLTYNIKKLLIYHLEAAERTLRTITFGPNQWLIANTRHMNMNVF